MQENTVLRTFVIVFYLAISLVLGGLLGAAYVGQWKLHSIMGWFLLLLFCTFTLCFFYQRRKRDRLEKVLAEKNQHSLAIQQELLSYKDRLENVVHSRTEAWKEVTDLNSIILQSVNEGIIGITLDEFVQFTNQQAEELLGYTAGELLNLPLHETVHYAHADGSVYPRDECPLHIALLAGTGKAEMEETVFWTKTGKPVTVFVSMTPLVKDGVPVGGVVCFHDISDEQLQKGLRKAVFENSLDGYVLFDEKSTIIDANKAALQLFQENSVADLQFNFTDRFLPEYQPNGDNSKELFYASLLLASSSGYDKQEIYLNLPDNPYCPCNLTLVRIPHGARYAVFGTIQNLQAAKNAEQSIIAERMRLQTLLDSCPIGMAIVRDDTIVSGNPRLANWLSLHPSDRLKASFVRMSDYLDILGKLNREEPVLDYPTQVYAAGREIKEIYLTALNTWMDDAPAILFWLVDITEIKNSEKNYREALSIAEEAAQTQSNFLARISHEIRTPMNAILGLGYLCMQTDLSPKQHNYLTKIHVSAQNLLGIINDILDFSKIESHTLEIHKTTFVPARLLETLAQSYVTRAAQKGLTLTCTTEPDLEIPLLGDVTRIEQVLSNLVHNAIKFTEKGGVQIHGEVLAHEKHSLYVLFWVRDTGIGISQENIQRLFQPFTQADESSTRRFGGTGLGLIIAKRLAELMGGHIWVESTIGAGSTFYFSARMEKIMDEALPEQQGRHSSPYTTIWENPREVEEVLESIAIPPSRPALASLPETPPVQDISPQSDVDKLARIQGASILLVEDNDINQEIATALLEDAGLRVTLAANGEEAITAVRKEPFDLVFMDIQMPVMDGLEATRAIRAIPAFAQKPPIVAMTAHSQASDREKSLASGMNDHITKPLDPTELVQTLIKWIVPLSEGDDQEKKDNADRVLRNLNQRVTPVQAHDLDMDLELHMDLDLNTLRQARPISATGIPPKDPSAQQEESAQPHIYPFSPHYPNLRVMEPTAGLESVGGNRALYTKLLLKFRDTYQTVDNDILIAAATGDQEVPVRLAHTIKGVAASLGMFPLSKVAEQIEKALKEQTHADDLFPMLSAELAEALQCVALETDTPLLPIGSKNQTEEDEDTNTPLGAEDAQGILLHSHVLEIALESDWVMVMDTMQDLIENAAHTPAAPFVKELEDAIDNFDIPIAKEILAKMRHAIMQSEETENP